VIGVITRRSQLPVVEEFFELFKTPWEVYRPGTAYDVIVATTDPVTELDAKLVLVYSSKALKLDAGLAESGGEGRGGVLRHGRRDVPVYGGLLTFQAATGCEPACVTSCGDVAGVKTSSKPAIVRLGYDLFDEIRGLLAEG
jgi:hypothetical protein